ncbi:Glycogen synthase, partial [Gryllus bimaculatus]
MSNMSGVHNLKGNNDMSDDNFSDDDENSPLYGGSQRAVPETKGWDVFRNPPPKTDSGSMANQRCLEITVKSLKVVAYLLTFIIVLGSGVIAKGTMLFMTSQLRPGKTITYCNKEL